MTSSPSRSGSSQPSPEINITPLVDVVLVLLIIFMVITPALAEGEQIELPEIFHADPKPKDVNPIDVALIANGDVMLDKERIDKATLMDRLRDIHKADPERRLMLKADAALPYGDVRDTFSLLQKVGFAGVSLKVIERKAGGEGS